MARTPSVAKGKLYGDVDALADADLLGDIMYSASAPGSTTKAKAGVKPLSPSALEERLFPLEALSQAVGGHKTPHSAAVRSSGWKQSQSLSSAWCFWADSWEADALGATKQELKHLGQVEQIKGFWDLFNALKLPKIRGSSWYVFKQGIRPRWEDEANWHGGHFTLLCPDESQIGKLWLDLSLGCVAGQWEGDEFINGAGISYKGPGLGYTLQLWVASRDKTLHDMLSYQLQQKLGGLQVMWKLHQQAGETPSKNLPVSPSLGASIADKIAEDLFDSCYLLDLDRRRPNSAPPPETYNENTGEGCLLSPSMYAAFDNLAISTRVGAEKAAAWEALAAGPELPTVEMTDAVSASTKARKAGVRCLNPSLVETNVNLSGPAVASTATTTKDETPGLLGPSWLTPLTTEATAARTRGRLLSTTKTPGHRRSRSETESAYCVPSLPVLSTRKVNMRPANVSPYHGPRKVTPGNTPTKQHLNATPPRPGEGNRVSPPPANKWGVVDSTPWLALDSPGIGSSRGVSPGDARLTSIERQRYTSGNDPSKIVNALAMNQARDMSAAAQHGRGPVSSSSLWARKTDKHEIMGTGYPPHYDDRPPGKGGKGERGGYKGDRYHDGGAMYNDRVGYDRGGKGGRNDYGGGRGGQQDYSYYGGKADGKSPPPGQRRQQGGKGAFGQGKSCSAAFIHQGFLYPPGLNRKQRRTIIFQNEQRKGEVAMIEGIWLHESVADGSITDEEYEGVRSGKLHWTKLKPVQANGWGADKKEGDAGELKDNSGPPALEPIPKSEQPDLGVAQPSGGGSVVMGTGGVKRERTVREAMEELGKLRPDGGARRSPVMQGGKGGGSGLILQGGGGMDRAGSPGNASHHSNTSDPLPSPPALGPPLSQLSNQLKQASLHNQQGGGGGISPRLNPEAVAFFPSDSPTTSSLPPNMEPPNLLTASTAGNVPYINAKGQAGFVQQNSVKLVQPPSASNQPSDRFMRQEQGMREDMLGPLGNQMPPTLGGGMPGMPSHFNQFLPVGGQLPMMNTGPNAGGGFGLNYGGGFPGQTSF